MKPVELTKAFRTKIREFPKDSRRRIGQALQQLEAHFGHPHLHQGLGIRKLKGNIFEMRAGLDLRVIFRNDPESLVLVAAGNHDQVQKFIRGL